MSTEHVHHNRETISLSTATIEQCRAIKVACDARIEVLERDAMIQVRSNLKTLAAAAGCSYADMLKRLAEGEGIRSSNNPYASRRPAGMAAAEKREAAKLMKYYDPESGVGWEGYGRAPAEFRDKDTDRNDYRKIEACKNPNWAGGTHEAESHAAE